MDSSPAFPEFVLALPEIEVPFPGARGWLIQGPAHQVVFIHFSETAEVPEHSHAEQWELPIVGKVDLRTPAGTTTYQSGESFFIPAGQPHAATVHAGYCAVIAFNAKDRYQPKA